MFNIHIYKSAADLCADYDPETMANLSPELAEAVDHLDDFQGYNFAVADNEQVIIFDECSGDVMETYTVADFIYNAIWAANDR